MRRPSLPTVAALGALAAAVTVMVVRDEPRREAVAEVAASDAVSRTSPAGRPLAPPGPGPSRRQVVEPAMPPLTIAWRREVTEQARDAPRPGATAFRAMADLYVEHNADLARQQATAEGLTVDEVRELTHLGLLVLATQRLPDVEDVAGRALTADERTALGALMRTASDDFKDELRALVRARVPVAERWRLIRDTEARYLASFAAITGLDADQVDALLGGNILLPGAPIATGPDDVPPPGTGAGDDGSRHDDGPRDSPLPPPRPSRP